MKREKVCFLLLKLTLFAKKGQFFSQVYIHLWKVVHTENYFHWKFINPVCQPAQQLAQTLNIKWIQSVELLRSVNCHYVDPERVQSLQFANGTDQNVQRCIWRAIGRGFKCQSKCWWTLRLRHCNNWTPSVQEGLFLIRTSSRYTSFFFLYFRDLWRFHGAESIESHTSINNTSFFWEREMDLLINSSKVKLSLDMLMIEQSASLANVNILRATIPSWSA